MCSSLSRTIVPWSQKLKMPGICHSAHLGLKKGFSYNSYKQCCLRWRQSSFVSNSIIQHIFMLTRSIFSKWEGVLFFWNLSYIGDPPPLHRALEFGGRRTISFLTLFSAFLDRNSICCTGMNREKPILASEVTQDAETGWNWPKRPISLGWNPPRSVAKKCSVRSP